MDKKLKAKWVKALRSGRYKQAEGFLKTADGKFCCLGVLCTISGADWVAGAQNEQYPTIGGKRLDIVNGEILRPSARKRFGLTHKQQDHLTRLNDGDEFQTPQIPKHSFKKIADYISKNL